jgi:hypothetical protein
MGRPREAGQQVGVSEGGTSSRVGPAQNYVLKLQLEKTQQSTAVSSRCGRSTLSSHKHTRGGLCPVSHAGSLHFKGVEANALIATLLLTRSSLLSVPAELNCTFRRDGRFVDVALQTSGACTCCNRLLHLVFDRLKGSWGLRLQGIYGAL